MATGCDVCEFRLVEAVCVGVCVSTFERAFQLELASMCASQWLDIRLCVWKKESCVCTFAWEREREKICKCVCVSTYMNLWVHTCVCVRMCAHALVSVCKCEREQNNELCYLVWILLILCRMGSQWKAIHFTWCQINARLYGKKKMERKIHE